MLWLSGGFCWRGVSEKTSCGEPKIMEMLDKPVDFVLFQLYPVEGWVYQSVVNKFIRENKNPSFSPPWKKHIAIYRHHILGGLLNIHKPLGVTKSDGVNVHPPCLFSWCFLWKKTWRASLNKRTPEWPVDPGYVCCIGDVILPSYFKVLFHKPWNKNPVMNQSIFHIISFTVLEPLNWNSSKFIYLKD